jgi:hypothetical protein
VNEHAGHNTSQFHSLPLTWDKINRQIKAEAVLWGKHESWHYFQHHFTVHEISPLMRSTRGICEQGAVGNKKSEDMYANREEKKKDIYNRLLFSFHGLFTSIKPKRLTHKHAGENKNCKHFTVK